MTTAALAFRKTPLEQWIGEKLQTQKLTRDAVCQHQLEQLNHTLRWARAQSSLYGQRLANLPDRGLHCLEDISQLPFTTQEDAVLRPGGLLCVSQGDIQRVVTLATSGTGGDPKRIFFTAEDLELALDFFAHGVSAVAASGERMLIALPGEREGSVGFQLAKGIARAHVIPVSHGVLTDYASTLALMEQQRVASIIGLPIQILALSYHAEALRSSAFRNLRSIVLCSDHVPTSLVEALRKRTNADVFEHYGMTEMGLGGGIDCEAHTGYHLRETDFYFEIVDPATGEPLPDGEEGEIVFTTLTRRGMPLIRYRTGDISRFLPDPCPCGTVLKRLERVRNRVYSRVSLGDSFFTLAMLDEALFAVPGVIDFSVSLRPGRLELLACAAPGHDELSIRELAGALDRVESIYRARRRNQLEVVVHVTRNSIPLSAAKRRIKVQESL